MVGFRGTAFADVDSRTCLPIINTNEDELEDVQWFERKFVASKLQGGSTALGFQPNESEAKFHIPGQSSLARLLITQWADERPIIKKL